MTIAIALVSLGICLFLAGVALISPPAALIAAGVISAVAGLYFDFEE